MFNTDVSLWDLVCLYKYELCVSIAARKRVPREQSSYAATKTSVMQGRYVYVFREAFRLQIGRAHV